MLIQDRSFLLSTQSAFLETIKAIKNKESGKLPQPKEDFGGKTTKYEAISWTESLAEKHRKLPMCLETEEVSGVGQCIVVGDQSTFLRSFFDGFPEGSLHPLKCIRKLIR